MNIPEALARVLGVIEKMQDAHTALARSVVTLTADACELAQVVSVLQRANETHHGALAQEIAALKVELVAVKRTASRAVDAAGLHR